MTTKIAVLTAALPNYRIMPVTNITWLDASNNELPLMETLTWETDFQHCTILHFLKYKKWLQTYLLILIYIIHFLKHKVLPPHHHCHQIHYNYQRWFWSIYCSKLLHLTADMNRTLCKTTDLKSSHTFLLYRPPLIYNHNWSFSLCLVGQAQFHL